jgi:hypothetical protein
MAQAISAYRSNLGRVEAEGQRGLEWLDGQADAGSWFLICAREFLS